MNHAGVFLVMMLLVLRDLCFFVRSIYLANVVWLLFTDGHLMFAFTVHLYSHTMYVFTVSFQISMIFASVRALVATKPFNVDIVDAGKMSLQITVMFKSFLANCARVPFKFARFKNFRIGNLLNYGQVDRGR